MSRSLGTVVATSALVVTLAAPALAATGSIQDPAGDATSNGLDITRAVLDNRDHQIRIRVRFDDVRRGDLVVSVDPRGDRGVRLISEHRPGRETRNYVAGGAFTDGGGGGAEPLECSGFQVRWSDDADRATLTLPSTCLQDGDYGAVRFVVLTERGGGDTDIAPGEPQSSGWIARG